MIKVKEAVIVEGKYDKIRLSSLIDALIIETDGFAVFSDKQRLMLIRRLAEKRGIIILTDSDAAGFRIRDFLSGALNPADVRHVYIPDISGKERRKSVAGKEGKLGVEGMTNEALIKAFQKAGIIVNRREVSSPEIQPITNADLYDDGLSGRPQSFYLRQRLLQKLDLPSRLSTSRLLQVLNVIITRSEYKCLVKKITEEELP